MKLPNLTDKLVQVYRKHLSIIIAVDFDDTIYNYSGQDFDVQYVIDLIKEAQEKLNAQVILFTCREEELLDFALDYCIDVGIIVDASNESIKEYNYPSRKPFYNILLDDKSSLEASCNSLKNVIIEVEKYGN